jgi:ATP-binding cassette, subfamily B, bacterial
VAFLIPPTFEQELEKPMGYFPFSKMISASSLPKDWAFLVCYLKPEFRRVAWMGSFLLAGIALQLASPQVIRFFLDTARASGAVQKLALAAGLYIGFAIFQQGTNLLAGYSSKQVSWSATNHLRADLALHCLRLDMPFHKQHTPGEMIERIDGDITQLANFLSRFTIQVMGNSLLVLGILLLLFRENTWVGAGMVVYTTLVLVILDQVKKLAVPRWAAARQASAEQFGFLEERISGVEEIRAAAAEQHTLRRLDGLMRTYLERVRVAWLVARLASNLTNLVNVIGYTAGLGLGVYLFTRGEASLGTAYLIVYYVGMLGDPLQSLREQAQDLQQATASLRRIQQLFDFQPEVSSPARSPQPLPGGALGIAFEKVSFHYEENENVLDGLTFAVQPRRILGILGRTGSGKSTLTRLLFRLYDPAEGSISLSGVNLRTVPLGQLRQRVGLVTQEVQLFQATVRENLTFFDPHISDEVLEEVLRALRLWEWVESLPGGLDAPLAANGQGISAGEAQLLTFGRVFLKDPGLVVLDEASSRLDPATETVMEHALNRLFDGRTGVVIAHRLKTVERADDILILEGGRQIEYGSRRELAGNPQSRFYHLLQRGMEEVLA